MNEGRSHVSRFAYAVVRLYEYDMIACGVNKKPLPRVMMKKKHEDCRINTVVIGGGYTACVIVNVC